MLNTNENQITINQNFPRNTLSLLNHSNIINTSKLLPNINLTIQSNTTRRNLSSAIHTNISIPEKNNKIKEDKYYQYNIKRIKEIVEQIHKRNSIKTEYKNQTPMERYNKIKKQFLTFRIEDNLNNKNFNSDNKKIYIHEITINEKDKDKIFYYKIDKGNNIKTVKECFKYRLNWKEVEENILEEDINLFWKPLSQKINFSLLSNENKKNIMANHFENHFSITNKLKMFINLMNFTENNNIDLFSFLPFTIIIDYGSIKFLKQFNSFINIFTNIEKFIEDSLNVKKVKRRYSNYFLTNYDSKSKIGMKTPLYIPKNHFDGRNLWLLKAVNLNRGMCIKLIDSKENCEDIIRNFYQGIQKNKIEEKDKICQNEKNKIENKNIKVNLLIKKDNNNNYNEIIKKNNENENKIKKENNEIKKKEIQENKNINQNKEKNNKKENENKNKENKIKPNKQPKIEEEKTIIKETKSLKNKNENKEKIKNSKLNYTEILNIKDKTKQKKTYQSSILILQKYIEKPLLYHNRKFDIRIWVLLTHKMEIFVFKEGHLKATSYDFNIKSSDLYIHLTNYSVQKHCENFSKFEYGNEISFNQFEDSLKNEYKLNINIKKDIYPKIYNIIRISLESVKDEINKFGRKGCFEIFGYDFMLDKDLNPFLIEINTNPGFEISSPLISKLVPRMIDDALRLTVDKVFGIKYNLDRFINGKFVSPFHVDGYCDEEIMYEKIFDFGEINKKK